MPLKECPDCKHNVSTSCEFCPQCGNTDFCPRTGETKTVECLNCGGTGKLPTDRGHMSCYECDGTGKSTTYQVINFRSGKKGWQRVKGGMIID